MNNMYECKYNMGVMPKHLIFFGSDMLLMYYRLSFKLI